MIKRVVEVDPVFAGMVLTRLLIAAHSARACRMESDVAGRTRKSAFQGSSLATPGGDLRRWRRAAPERDRGIAATDAPNWHYALGGHIEGVKARTSAIGLVPVV